MDNTREVNVPDEQEDGEETIVSPEDAQSLEQEPESSAGGSGVEAKPKAEEAKVEPEKVIAETVPLEPRPVEGETPREYALRKEVESLRRDKREMAKNNVINKAKPAQPALDVSELLAMGYTETDIENSKKLISTLAPAMGFVNKSQTYQETANQELEKFLEEHSEYLPKNDKNDVRWGKFIEIIGTDYNLSNKTPKQLKTIYEKVDRDVKGELGEVKNSDNKTKAQVQKIQSVSHTGGNKTILSSPKNNTAVKEVDGIKLIGFDDDDLK
jgi:rubrerythrin